MVSLDPRYGHRFRRTWGDAIPFHSDIEPFMDDLIHESHLLDEKTIQKHHGMELSDPLFGVMGVGYFCYLISEMLTDMNGVLTVRHSFTKAAMEGFEEAKVTVGEAAFLGTYYPRALDENYMMTAGVHPTGTAFYYGLGSLRKVVPKHQALAWMIMLGDLHYMSNIGATAKKVMDAGGDFDTLVHLYASGVRDVNTVILSLANDVDTYLLDSLNSA